MDSRVEGQVRTGRRWWVRTTAVAALVSGVAASAWAGTWWRGEVERQREDEAAGRIDAAADAVIGAVRRDSDLIAGATALLDAVPDLDTATFQTWLDGVMATGRYPGVNAFGTIELVRREDAPGALARLAKNAQQLMERLAARGLTTSRPRDLTLDPGRPFYCLPGVMAVPPTAFLRPVQPPKSLDICTEPNTAQDVQIARDSGEAIVNTTYLKHGIAVGVPFYRGGGTPASLVERRATFVGVLAVGFDGRALLREALGDRSAWVELAHGESSDAVTVLATNRNRQVRGVVTDTVRFDDGYRLRVAVPAAAAGPSPWSQGMTVFGLGSIVSVLVCGLLALAGRSREQALKLVDERTAELKHLALHDRLTGLPNRTLVMDRAAHMLQRAQRTRVACAAMFLDLDYFKDINDTLGHQAGDRLLEQVASRLQRVVRDGDTVGRLGGDEFVVLLEGDATMPTPELVAERILEVLGEPFRLTDGDATYRVGASIGIALGTDLSADELLRNADLALYEAKAGGRNRFVAYELGMHEAVQDRLELAMQLREAVERRELFVEYQPTFDVETGDIEGVEALVRWAHPTRGVVPPLEFIPIAEETDVIVDVGTWVLREACTQMARWRADGYRLELNVNVSSRQLLRDDFVDTVESALRDAGLPADSLVLEITESLLVADPEATAAQLGRLKALGVKVAIDDFGTGYSSLSYLRQFPVDSIKIDRTFLTDLGHSDEATALLHSLIQLGKNLGLETVAEGVEDTMQVRHLRREQCDTAQGYLFARPLGVDDAGRFLARVCRPTAPTGA